MKNIKKTLNQNNPLGRHSGLHRNDVVFANGPSGLNNATACGLAMKTASRLCEEAKPTKQSRDFFRRFLSALGLTVAFLAAPSAYASIAGYVQFVNGNVQITSPTGQVRPAQKGDAINEGDTLTSAQKSSVQVKMQDGGFVAVRPDTQLKFDQFVFAGKEDGSEKSFYSLFKGGFRAVTGLIGRINKQNYKITTPAATIGIRGTDHETFLITPDSPLAQVAPPGAYNKVNVGETYMATEKGTIFVLPNQMGYAGGMDQMPRVQPVNTKVFTVAEAATPEAKAEKKEEKEEKADPITPTMGPWPSVILPPPPPPIACVGTTCVDLTLPSVDYAAQATAVANQAAAAAAAAQEAANTAAANNTTLTGIAQVSTAPAVTAIGTATTGAVGAISTASPLVSAATALAPANAATATANATAAQTAANTAGGLASAAQTAFAANGAFADSTAITANSLINTPTTGANALVQSANTLVQTAAGTVTAQNTELTIAQGAASTALGTASTNLTAANTNLSTANTQNTAIATAQSSTATQLTAAAAAVTWANTAADNAQTAATLAASLQAAGDRVGAQAQLLIAQQELAFAQQQLAIAQAAQAAVTTQLAAAQAAATAAGAAVTTATNAANTAATAAGTGPTGAQTYAAAAQTAATSAGSALTTTSNQLVVVNTNAPIVATYAPIAAYNNPAVATPNRFIGVLSTVVAPAAGQYIEGYGPGAGFTGAGTANTSFVLDGSGNLVESRHTWYEETPASTATPQLLVADANVKRTGGTAAETFKLPDSSIYGGRWTGGSITVTDNATVVPTFTRSFGATSEHWAIMLAPPTGYVQALTGTTAYTKVAATSPTDALGNAGVLNTATLSANFTSQLVSAALNLTISAKTLDVVAANMAINGPSFSTGTQVSCTGCGASIYYAHVGGLFAGDVAASAGLFYTLWTGAAPGATTGATDLIQGLVAFSATTAPTYLPGGPFAAYVPSGVTVALSSPNWWSDSGWDNSFTVAPADIAYTGGLPSSFINRWDCATCNSNTITVLGAANPVNGVATSNVTTGIEFGRWTTSTAIQHTYVNQLGTQYGAPDSWMYGPRGYLDAVYTGFAGVPIGAMAATFSYQLDGNTAPYDRDTGLTGTLTSATLTANFTAMTVSAALGLSMPGGETWAANVANQPVYGNSFSAYANAGGTANTLAVTRNGAACPTCGGNLQGGFTGQNYAGAILTYLLYDRAASGDFVGKAALTRNFAGNTNPAVTNGTPAPTGTYFVADYGGSLQWVDAITATGNLLTGYSSGTPGTSGSGTTVTCTTCTTAATGDVANSGIYYGTWQAGGWTNTWGGNISPGQFHWITGPEAGPVYLPEVLTGTVTYALDGGTAPTNLLGTAGTLNTATLTVNFTRQVVGISLSALVAGNTWNAFTAPGNEAPLDYNTAFGRTAFYASSYQGGGPGTLTVSVSNVDGALPANGWVSGNLTGGGLTGAVLSYTLNGYIPTASFQSWDQINGVAAFVAPASDIAAPYRMVGVALTDPTAAVPLPGMAGLYNAASRMTSDVTGNLTQFDISPLVGGVVPSLTLAPGTSTLANFGSDPLTGISWGRWQGGVINVTDRATGVVTPITLQGSAHWLAGPTMTAPVTLPVSGTFAYTLAGGTVPTNNLGTTGTLNSATLSADFTAQTVDVGVNATVGATTLGASATGVPIIQGAGFAVLNPLAVTCAGTCGAVGSHGGQIIGGFTGAGATGAGMMYSLGTGLGGAGATVISGVAAFHR